MKQSIPPVPSINCDLGESWALQRSGEQRKILSLCDLANIACGAHAGDRELTRQSIEETVEAGVRAGAHPGYPDPEHFGRRPLFRNPYTTADISALVAEQVAFAQDCAQSCGSSLYHVKVHGALYNEAAADGEVAEAIAFGVRQVCRDVFLVGLAQSVMVNVFRRQGFTTLREAFADRRYTPKGLLVPRTDPRAQIEDPAEALAQIGKLARFADTVCVHSDSPNALAILRALRGLDTIE
ncbi:5-oxoprolinase subunit PxpA [Bryobacter aggregatus]|uniref:5-oxoprolinase subunit PxpA n=1 Tax=Bryobacter aggregatus TaxID=360054 RepID=UPI0004E23794|nr:5-oxoprolinase subunit PxpA [Bryobacter aggregatus]